jgi:hypothetical protein
MNIFPNTPEVTEEDATRFQKVGYLRSWNCLNASLAKHDTSVEDLKKLIILEVTALNPRLAIYGKLIVRLQKAERNEIQKAIDSLKS